MKNEVLVIVDMVNGFIHTGPLADKKINAITPNIIKLIKKSIANNVTIIAFVDSHTHDAEEFARFPVHCLAGSYESELIPELKPFQSHFKIIPKNTTNGFKTETFQNIVRKHNFDKVTVVGCCTDICVEDFVSTYLQFNRVANRNTKIVVPSSCVATFDTPAHNAKEHQDAALKRMSKLGANIVREYEQGE